MAALDLPAGYRITRTGSGYALDSDFGPLGDDYGCWAAACFAAQAHADALAQDGIDELAWLADFDADEAREAA